MAVKDNNYTSNDPNCAFAFAIVPVPVGAGASADDGDLDYSGTHV